jgi:hypothetical protein
LGWKGMWHEQFFWIDTICLWSFSVFLEVKMGTLYICKIFYAWTTIYLKIPNLVKFFQSNSVFLCFVIKLKFIHNEFYVLVFCNRTKVSSQPRFYVFLSPITKLEKKSWFAF